MACSGQIDPQRGGTAPPRPPPPGQSASSSRSGNSETTATFTAFQKLHDRAYAIVRKGLTADEEGNIAAAEQYYTSSLLLLDEALETDHESLLGITSGEIDAVKQMQQKMNKTKLQISYRLEFLRSREQSTAHQETCSSMEMSEEVRLPSYEEAVSDQPPAISGNVLDDGMRSQHPFLSARQQVPAEGTELFSIPDGVQIFHITYEGYVSTPSYPTSLRIVRFQEPVDTVPASDQDSAPPAFLQVGDWIYPMIPGASPILHTNYDAYLFPDLSLDGSGSSVGLMLPNTLSQEERHALEDILRNFSNVQEQQLQPEEDNQIPSSPTVEPQASQEATCQNETNSREKEQQKEGVHDKSTSEKISQGILVASEWISWGLRKGAEKAGEMISYGSTKLRNNLHPESDPKQVDHRVQKGAMYARRATHTAVSVSAFLVTKLGEATVALGRKVAPHVRSKGKELIPNSMQTEENKSKMDGVLEVASSGLKGFGTVYLSLEAAARALGKSIANETVATVQYKYGPHAGRLAKNTVYAMGNVVMTAYVAENLAMQAIVQRTAVNTGEAVIDHLRAEEPDMDQTKEPVTAKRQDGHDKEKEKEKLPM